MAEDRAGVDACPVCRTPGPRFFMQVAGSDYWRCECCEARFLDPRQHPSQRDEHAYYRRHENDPDDPRYRAFLSKLAEPLLETLGSPRTGLDFGCGPGPALASMLEQAGHRVALYDPLFFPDPGPLDRMYEFITCTEVIEHFHAPADEFDRLGRMLQPGGWLGLTTCFQTDDARFANWHYRRDPTHVVFYREATLRLIAEQRGWACRIPAKDVAIMMKP